MVGMSGIASFGLAPIPTQWMPLQEQVFHLSGGISTFRDSRPGWACARHCNPRIERLDRQGPFALEGDRFLVGEALLKNREELCARFAVPRVAGSGPSDIEILAHTVQALGMKAVHALKGYFAFALWDEKERTLALARDRTGDRTAFYGRGDGFAAFGTLPTTLIDLPFIDDSLDEVELAHSLVRTLGNRDATLFRAVKQVPPGAIVTLTPAGETIETYWELAPKSFPELRTRDDYAEAMREELDRAGAYMARCDGTGQLGIGLSGGLDSTSVAALVAPRLADEGRELIALSMVPAADEQDQLLARDAEGELARIRAMVAAYPNIRLILGDPSGSPIYNGVEDLNRIAGQPFASSARWYGLHPHFESCSKNDVGVLLGGWSGNGSLSWSPAHYYYRLRHEGRYGRLIGLMGLQLIAGNIPKWDHFAGRLRSLFLSPAGRTARIQKQSYDPAYGLSQNLRRKWKPLRDEWLATHGISREGVASQLFDPRILEDGTVLAFWRAATNSFQQNAGWIQAAVRVQYGVEMRDVPGDSDLWELACSIPEDIAFHWKERRHLIKRAMRGRVPDLVLDQKSKAYAVNGISRRLAEGGAILEEHLDKIANSPMCQQAIDTERLKALVDGIPSEELTDLASNYEYISGISPVLTAGAFIHWMERGRPMNGLTQTTTVPPRGADPFGERTERCEALA